MTYELTTCWKCSAAVDRAVVRGAAANGGDLCDDTDSSSLCFWRIFTRVVFACLVATSLFTSIACDGTKNIDAMNSPKVIHANCDVSRAVSEERGRIELKHDLHVVRPQSRTTKTFALINQSGIEWHIDKIGASCGCTVASVSKQDIEPGEQLTVTTEFTAGGEEFKESYIDIGLTQPAALSFRLSLMANVRLPMSLSASSIDFGLVEAVRDADRSGNAERVFEVRNFTESPWTEIVAESSAEWCSVNSVAILRTSATQAPCQIWRVSCAICPDALSTEKETASIHVRSAGSNLVIDAALCVTARRKPIMSVSPPNLFFGVVKRGDVATRKLTVALNLGATPITADVVDCVVSPELSSILEIDVKAQKTTLYLITAKLQQKAYEESGPVTGQLISLAVRGRPESRIEVPVFAKFVD